MTVPGTTRIFLSAVSGEFRSYRLKLANQLGALKGTPYEVKVQEDFQQGGHTLLERLADYIRGCDLAIHIVGDALGARPSPEHERTLLAHLGEPASTAAPGWSYTQWEYELARRFGKRVMVYLAEPEAPRDCGLPVRQSEDEARLQQDYLRRIRESGEHYKPFTGLNHLVREAFHDLGLEPNLKVNNLPYRSLGSLFKGRDEFLKRIREALGRVDHRGHQRFAAITASATAAAVHGLGGIGKTRAAIEFGLQHAEEYTALLFVRADSPASLERNLAALCGPIVLDLAEKDARETEVQLAAVLRWLQQHPGWFLILDNVDSDDAAKAVEALLARLQSAGQVLVTSRLSRWSGGVEALALDVLAEADAAEFLLERTGPRRRKAADDAAQARVLAVELGQLALALEQAAAYIAERRQSFAQYLVEWRTKHDKVLAWFDERVMQYPMSVAVTWQTSFDQLTPAARALLHRLAWFAPDPIPESLLEVPGAAPTVADSGGDAADALADLEAYSLATRADESANFSVHRLVQDVTRRSLDDAEHRALTEALAWINAAFVGDPQDVRSWPTLDPLAPHARAAAEHADQAGIGEPTSRLMNQLASLLLRKARHAEAEPLMRRVVKLVEKSLGKDHPNVAGALNDLAQLLQATDRQSEAEPLMRRALAMDESSYGKDHPTVAIRLNNLALLLQATNRLAEAEPLMRRALAIDESRYGHDHPNIATDLNNLASLLGATNRLAEAEPLMRRALAIDESSYGNDHPEVATDLHNLASLLQATNRLADAEPLMRRALALDEVSYGKDHPDVARDLNNLALLLQATKRPTEAEPLMRRALAIDESSYGKDDPHVAIRLNNLAQLLRATNRMPEAEPFMRRVAGIFERSLGTDHPNVAIALNNLAQLLQATNRFAEAEPLLRRTVEILLKFTASTEHEHPHLRSALRNYAALLQASGLSEADARRRVSDLLNQYRVSLG